ncbi:MAG: PEP/pyruvate-binding domain-containing protein [Candidatus Thiodiazotropha sp.]
MIIKATVMVIHVTQGLGEKLVSGQTSGDEFLLAEELLDDTLKLREFTPGTEAQQALNNTEGKREADSLSADHAPLLSEQEVLQLAEQLRLAAFALDYTKPDFDLEWAWDGKQFWILQARPITAINRCTYPELSAQPDIWTRGNTKDVPEPLSPID